MKRTAIQRKTPLKPKTRLSTRKSAKKRSQSKTGGNKKLSGKGYKPPAWFNRIKLTYSEHGNTTAQKRLWRVITDTYRKEEWEMYGPFCPVCGQSLPDWRDGQMLHWFRYSLCNSWLKWERRNMIFGCRDCNLKDDEITNWKISELLRLRYGEDILLWIEQENLRLQQARLKIETWHIVDYVARLRPDLVKD